MNSSRPYGMKEPSQDKPCSFCSLVLVNMIFFGWTLLSLPCTIILSILYCVRFKNIGAFIRKANWRYGRILLWLVKPWMAVKIANPHMAVQYPGSIIVCNHQSYLDLYLFAAQNQSHLSFIVKSWPFRILFFFAPAMRSAGYIDAESLPSEEVERQSLTALQQGATLVIFPEGRRTRSGALGKFHSGAFHLSQQSGRPILPLIIHNSFQIAPPGRYLLRPKTIEMEFLPPVWPESFTTAHIPRRAMLRHVRDLYLERLNHQQMEH